MSDYRPDHWRLSYLAEKARADLADAQLKETQLAWADAETRLVDQRNRALVERDEALQERDAAKQWCRFFDRDTDFAALRARAAVAEAQVSDAQYRITELVRERNAAKSRIATLTEQRDALVGAFDAAMARHDPNDPDMELGRRAIVLIREYLEWESRQGPTD